jgi:hypothetical protein
MNAATKEIMKLLKIDLDNAIKVQSIMEMNGLDFSECSAKEFVNFAIEAHDELEYRTKKALTK